MSGGDEKRVRGPDRRNHDQRQATDSAYQGPERRLAERRQRDRRSPAS